MSPKRFSKQLSAADEADENEKRFQRSTSLAFTNANEDHEHVLRKLYQAATLCFLFFIFELVGGYLAHSLAVLSDAAHLFADLSSFVIAILAANISQWSANSTYTFGFQRVEALAALFSMSSLLVVSLFLAIEAVHRGWLMYLQMNGADDLIEPIDGKLMSLTAGIGVIVNLALAAILGEHHVHLPGFDDHDHDHSHDHAHARFKDQAQEQHSHDHSHASSNYHATDDHSHDHSRHANSDDHSHAHSPANADDHSHDHSHANSDDHSHDHSQAMADDHSHDHCHDELVNQTQDDHSHNHFHENPVDLVHSNHHLSVDGSISNSNLDETDISYGSEKSPLLNGKSHDEEQGHPKHVESAEEMERNLNLHAAYVHVLSDLVQSVFVLVSGLAIWHDASWQFMDPICTIGFCIIVTKSSFGVILNSVKLLMNTAPPDVEWRSVYEAFQNVKGVSNVHNLHIWVVSQGNTALSVHADADNIEEALQSFHQICKRFKVEHSTIQLQPSHLGECVTCHFTES